MATKKVFDNRLLRPVSTGTMRDFLLDRMVAVANGDMDHATALTICRLSQQVYNFVNLEIRAANLEIKRGSLNVNSLEFKGGKDAC